MRISRPSAPAASVSLSLVTTASISVSAPSLAEMISVLVPGSASTLTGLRLRWSGDRLSNSFCRIAARFAASVDRSLRIRTGGRSAACRPSRLRMSESMMGIWSGLAATITLLVASITSKAGSTPPLAVSVRLEAAMSVRNATISWALASLISKSRTSRAGPDCFCNSSRILENRSISARAATTRSELDCSSTFTVRGSTGPAFSTCCWYKGMARSLRAAALPSVTGTTRSSRGVPSRPSSFSTSCAMAPSCCALARTTRRPSSSTASTCTGTSGISGVPAAGIMTFSSRVRRAASTVGRLAASVKVRVSTAPAPAARTPARTASKSLRVSRGAMSVIVRAAGSTVAATGAFSALPALA